MGARVSSRNGLWLYALCGGIEVREFFPNSLDTRLPRVRVREIESRTLGEELDRVFVDDPSDGGVGVTTTTEFKNQIGDSGRPTRSPVAGRVGHQPFRPVLLNHIGGTLWRAFGDWIESHAGPKAGFEYRSDRMLFDVVDQDAATVNSRIATQHIQDHTRSLILVFQVGRVDQDLLVVPDGQFHVLKKDGRFVLRILVQSDLADSQDVGAVQKLRDHRQHFARERNVLSFLRVDAQPSEVLNPELSGTLGLRLGQLPKVIAKTIDAAPVKTGPESRFTKGNAPHLGQRFIVVRSPRNHVNVGVNVVHGHSPEGGVGVPQLRPRLGSPLTGGGVRGDDGGPS